MKDYLKYSPQCAIKRRINYKEVWQGFPVSRSEFVRVPLFDSHEAWSYEDNNFSIWVIGPIMREYRQNPLAIFVVSMRRKDSSRQKSNVLAMRHFEGRLEDAVQDAIDCNNKEIRSCGHRKYV